MKFTANNFSKYKFRGSILLFAAFFIGALLRLTALENRPMHVDEAVHAVKFGELLEKNYYRYNPVEYHGPALNYLTLIPAYLSGVKTAGDLTENILRTVPALCGILLIFFFFFLRKELGDKLLLIVITFLSFSSMLIFYSRYYIQESLLVSFTFCFIISLYKFLSGKKRFWIIAGGIFAGLAFASKETSVIAFGSIAITLFILILLQHKSFSLKFSAPSLKQFIIYHLSFIIFISSFIVVSFLLYSSFLANPHGILDSLKAISNYFFKAADFPDHIYPWHYYFSLIFFRKIDSFTFTEIFIFLFAVAGIFFTVKDWKKKEPKNEFIKIIFIFTIITTIVYSIIPYKTPWTMMTFWTGILIVAAYGVNETIAHSHKYLKYIFILSAAVGIIHQALQAYQISFRYQYNPRNPFVYSQATPDLEYIERAVKEITSPEKGKTFICIAAEKDDYWPLPWYLRSFKNTAWYNSVPDEIYQFPVILAKPDMEEKIIEKIYSAPAGKVNLYLQLFEKYTELRPGVEIRGYIQKDLYDKYLRLQNGK